MRRRGQGTRKAAVRARLLQVTGLVVTLVAATAFFGTPSTVAMLRMMLVGVLIDRHGLAMRLRSSSRP